MENNSPNETNPEKLFTDEMLLKSIFDPVLNREVSDYLKELDEAGKLYPASEIIDLRTVPRSEWERYVGGQVACPPDVQAYLDGKTDAYTQSEIDSIEDRIDAFYGLQPEYTIIWDTKRNIPILFET